MFTQKYLLGLMLFCFFFVATSSCDCFCCHAPQFSFQLKIK